MRVQEIANPHRKDRPDIVVDFASTEEWIGKVDSKHFRSWQNKSEQEWQSWTGEYLPTWMHVKDRNHKATPEALEMLDAARQRIKDSIELPEMKSRKRKRTLHETEGDLDVERYLSGDVNIFEHTKREVTQGKQEVTIVIDVGTNWSVDPKNIFWKGAAGLLIAEICEEKGYTTEVWGCSTTSGSCEALDGRRLMVGVPLKTFQDPFDAATMANALSGWFFRTVNFTMRANLCEFLFEQKIRGTLGQSVPASAAMLTALTGEEDAYYIVGIESVYGAVDVVLSTIEAIRKASGELDDPESAYE